MGVMKICMSNAHAAQHVWTAITIYSTILIIFDFLDSPNFARVSGRIQWGERPRCLYSRRCCHGSCEGHRLSRENGGAKRMKVFLSASLSWNYERLVLWNISEIWHMTIIWNYVQNLHELWMHMNPPQFFPHDLPMLDHSVFSISTEDSLAAELGVDPVLS